MAQKAQYTPGPWKVDKYNALYVIANIPGNDEQVNLVAEAKATDIRHPEPEALANARLIAAAPDLLHAINGDHGDRLNFVASLLMEARNLPLPNGVDWDAWVVTLDEADLFVKEARAAIAKAQGGAK